jgi:hypothetical protein
LRRPPQLAADAFLLPENSLRAAYIVLACIPRKRHAALDAQRKAA